MLTAHLSAWMHRRVQAWKQGPGAELRQQRPQPPGSAHISSIPVLHSPGAPPGGPAYIELGAAAIVALWCCSQREMSASSLFSLLLFHAGVWHFFFLTLGTYRGSSGVVKMVVGTLDSRKEFFWPGGTVHVFWPGGTVSFQSTDQLTEIIKCLYVTI